MGLLDLFQRVHKNGIAKKQKLRPYKDKRVQYYVENFVFRLDEEHIVAVFTDMTALREAHGQIESTYKEFKSVLDSVSAYIYVSDLNTHDVILPMKPSGNDWVKCRGKSAGKFSLRIRQVPAPFALVTSLSTRMVTQLSPLHGSINLRYMMSGCISLTGPYLG